MMTISATSPLRAATAILALALGSVAGGVELTGAADASDQPPPYPSQWPIDRDAAPLSFAFISYANPQQVAKNIVPVVQYLEPYVGLPIQGFVTLDYGSAIEAMRSGKADLATIDPLAFMMAHERIGAKPLVLEIYAAGHPTYHSCIWVRRDSDIKATTDLKSRTIAFADHIDMSGHLLPRDIFVQQGLIAGNRLPGDFFKQVYFAGGDEQAIRAVVNRFVDAAGISQYAYLLLKPQERDLVTTIARSIDSPSHLIMARKGLGNQVCQRVQQALLALDRNRPQDKVILGKLYGVQGYAEAELSDFAAVAKVASRYGFVKNPDVFSDGEPAAIPAQGPPKSLVNGKAAPGPQKPPVLAQPVNEICPFSGDPIDPSVTLSHEGIVYGFCCRKCVRTFAKNPQATIAKIEQMREPDD